MTTKYESVKVKIDQPTPILDLIGRSVGPDHWGRILGYIAGEPSGLQDLAKELTAVSRAIAKASGGRHCGGPVELRLRLAEVEERAERAGEADIKCVHERKAADLRKQIAEG
jgi:hypothetical protein